MPIPTRCRSRIAASSCLPISLSIACRKASPRPIPSPRLGTAGLHPSTQSLWLLLPWPPVSLGAALPPRSSAPRWLWWPLRFPMPGPLGAAAWRASIGSGVATRFALFMISKMAEQFGQSGAMPRDARGLGARRRWPDARSRPASSHESSARCCSPALALSPSRSPALSRPPLCTRSLASAVRRSIAMLR